MKMWEAAYRILSEFEGTLVEDRWGIGDIPDVPPILPNDETNNRSALSVAGNSKEYNAVLGMSQGKNLDIKA